MRPIFLKPSQVNIESLPENLQNENVNTINMQESTPTMINSTVNTSANSNRAFGKEISNFVSSNQNQQSLLEAHRKAGRSLSMNMPKSTVNQFLRKQTLAGEQPMMESLVENPVKTLKTLESIKDENERVVTIEEYAKSPEMEKADVDHLNHPSYVAEYVKDIFEYLKQNEEKYMAKSAYMTKIQIDINDKMRAILIDWLVDVHLKFKLLPETLFMTVNIIDRFLEKVPVSRKKLQLVGVSAMLIACKYEEIYAPEVKDFVYVTDKAYTKEEVLDMEGKILSGLEFNLTSTSAGRFLERFNLLNDPSNEKKSSMARYLIELSLVEYKMLKYSPSLLAASALYLSNKIFKSKIAWSDILARNSKFTETELRPCAKDLCILMQNADKSNLQAVRRKFSSPKYHTVAKIQLEKN